MSSVRQAFALSFLTRYISLVTQFVASVAIARLLTPAEVGVFSIAAALVFLAQTIRDFGTGQYIVQEKELTEDRIRAAFSVTLLLGCAIGISLILIAPAAGRFYKHEGIEQVMKLVSATFFLLPFGTITSAYYARHLNFRPITIAGVSTAIVQSVTSVGCAWFGLSYMSMAWGSLAGTITTILVMFAVRPPEVPLLPGFRELKRVLTFGSKISLVEILNDVSFTVSELVIGKTLGLHSVGIFSRAQGVSQLFSRLISQGITPVITPLFAKTIREEGTVRTTYLKATDFLLVASWPFLGVLFILAPEFVLTLYGEKWVEAIPVVRLLCIGLVVYYLTSLAERMMLASGEVNRLFKFSLLYNLTRIGCLVIGAMVSVEAIALMVTVAYLLRIFMLKKHLRELADIVTTDYHQLLLIALVVSAASIATTLAGIGFCKLMGADANAVVLIVGAFSAGIGWLLSVRVIDHPYAEELRRVELAIRGALRRQPVQKQ